MMYWTVNKHNYLVDDHVDLIRIAVLLPINIFLPVKITTAYR